MKHAAYSRNTEAGFLFPSGWRRDSARRLPLRQTAPSIGRDLSPQYGRETGHESAGRDEEDRMEQVILWTMGTLCLWASAASWRTALAVRRQTGSGRPRIK